MGKPDKEVIRKQDYNHIYRARQRQKSKHKDKSQNGFCPCVFYGFFYLCALLTKHQTHIFVFCRFAVQYRRREAETL